MKIGFEGKTWSYDDDLITVGQAEQIEDGGPWSWANVIDAETGETEPKTGRSIFDWRQAVNESQARAFRFLYWVMREQNGEPVPLEECSFAFGPFVGAFVAAWRAEIQARAAEAEPDPTQPPATGTTPAGPRPAEPPPSEPRPPSRRPSPGS